MFKGSKDVDEWLLGSGGSDETAESSNDH